MGFDTGGGDTGAPSDASYLTSTGEPELSNETVVENPENTPTWTEDGNSPFTAAGVTSTTVTLADSFDLFKVTLEATDQATTNGFIGVQVNGDSSTNYNNTDQSGSQTIGEDRFREVLFIGSGTTEVGLFTVTGRWGGGCRLGLPLTNSALGELQAGNNGAVSSPLTQFTLLRASSFDVEGRVYGLAVH